MNKITLLSPVVQNSTHQETYILLGSFSAEYNRCTYGFVKWWMSPVLPRLENTTIEPKATRPPVLTPESI